LVTLCLKNLFGFVTYADRKRYHRAIDLGYGLVDIAKVVRPAVNLIDGIVAMEGMGAHSGTPVDSRVLVASTDMTAADIVGTRIMGFDPLEPVSTQVALKDGLGITAPDQIAVVGTPVAEVQQHFARPVFRLVHPAPNVEVLPGGICPGCISRIPKIPTEVDPAKRYAVVIGKRVHYPSQYEFDEIWCLGDCGIEEGRRLKRRRPELAGRIKTVPGCPPLDWWRAQTIDKEMEAMGLTDEDEIHEH